MSRLVALLAMAVFVCGCASAPRPKFAKDLQPGPHPLYVSSLGGTFPLQIAVDGTFQLHPDSIEVNIRSADLRVGEYPTYNGRRQISAVKLGVATTTTGNQWRAFNTIPIGRINETVQPGTRLQLHPTTIHIPISPSFDLSQHWFVVEIQATALDRPAAQQQIGSSYAHSGRDIFAKIDRR